MERKIPLYFDTVIINSPIQEIQNTNSNVSRLKVGVFTKYKNRNGSYITDEYAEHLIESATKGNIPVVGFFDPETQEWASHTGPTLANGYGYVESFVGWEPFTDTDGVTRDYAVFSVILFTEYFDEARKVIGQNQSMELDPQTIDGDWARFDDAEYFVYKKGDMKGFCIIGAHEPCFSVSSFFSKNDEAFEIQYEKFSSLLSDLKTVVEEAEKIEKGGEQPMEDFNEKVVVEQEVAPLAENAAVQANEFQAENNDESTVVEPEVELQGEETPASEDSFEQIKQEEENNSEFEALQRQLTELQQNYEMAQARIMELEQAIADATKNYEALQTTNEELTAKVQNYEAQAAQLESNKKEELINTYSQLLDSAEEIDNIREHISDFSYEALESKLAISFANKQIADKKVTKVLLPEPESSFAALMKNYKK